MYNARIVGLALTVAALATYGCGSSSKGQSQTRAKLIASADTICHRVNATRDSVAIISPQEYTRILPLVADERSAVVELGKLVPPATLASDWSRIVANFRLIAADTRTYVQSLKAQDVKGAEEALRSMQTAQQHMVAVTRHDGFSDCAQIS
jgi:hypothetical protein